MLRNSKFQHTPGEYKATAIAEQSSHNPLLDKEKLVSVATPAEPPGDKIFFFVQILGSEKPLEKCR